MDATEASRSETIPEPCVCAFLCAYSYDRDRVPPCSFEHGCEYRWKWPLAYSPLSDWKRFGCADSDAQCLFAYRGSDGTVFVVFRGTDSWRDAVINASVYKKPLPFMEEAAPAARVHGGFFRQYRAVLGAVEEYIARHPERQRMVFTGHSLGAAVAILCACRVKADDGAVPVRCVVFGSPRVGNAAFVRRAEAILSVERFVVGNDPVAHLPSRLRWKHVGGLTRYVGGKRVAVRQGDGIANALRLPNPFGVPDHSVAEYIDCLASDPQMYLDGGAPRPTLPWWRAAPGDAFLCLAFAAWALASFLRS